MNALAGTRTLMRLILRRDRIALPVWIGLAALVAYSYAGGFITGYPTPAALQAYADEVTNSPATIALLGTVQAPTLGGLTAWRYTMGGIFILGIASVLTVVRHTRTEEKAGRGELVESAATGRHAPLAAALIVTWAADLLAGLLAAAALISLGLPAAGSLALGLSVAGAAGVLAAVAGVGAQAFSSPGAARATGLGALALFWVMRGVGDAGGGLGWLAWLTPYGWARLTRPFAGEQWGVFLLFIAAAGLLAALAFALEDRRDVGAGLLPQRPGPASAAPGLRSPTALAWRLERGSVLGWAAAFALIGVAFGYVAQTVTDVLAANPAMLAFFQRTAGGARPSDIVFTLFLAAFGPVIAIFAMAAVLRLRSEETSGLAGPLLAAPVSRGRWAAGQLSVAALGPAVVLAAFGLAAGLTYGASSGATGRELPRVLGASLAYLPAIWVMAGIAALLYGWAPRLAALSWAVLVAFMFLEGAWEFRLIGPAVFGLSPFAHTPKVLVGQGVTAAFLGLVAIAAALAGLGLAGLRRRDLSAG